MAKVGDLNINVDTGDLGLMVERLEKIAEQWQPATLENTLTDVKRGVMYSDVAFMHGGGSSPPQRHPGSIRFHELLNELGELHDRKQADYGQDDDPFANVRSSAKWNVPAWIGALIRLNDKVVRLQSFAQKGNLVNESAEDSLRDIAVYALIALVLLEEDKNDC